MTDLNEIIKSNKGGVPYSDGSRWWTLPGVEPFALSALKNLLIKLAIMRGRLHPLGEEENRDGYFKWWIEDVKFVFDGLVGEEKIVLTFTHRVYNYKIDGFGAKKVWMNNSTKIKLELWNDGFYAVSVDGKPQDLIRIEL